MSVCLAGILTVTHQGATCDAASVHFGQTMRRTDIFVVNREFLIVISYICYHITHLVTRTADDRRKDGTRSVVSSEAGLAHAGAVVAHQRGNLVVAHFRRLVRSTFSKTPRNDPSTTSSV